MAGDGEEKNADFYSTLGMEKECSEKELKTAYKKLAMKWHPDKLSDSARVEQVEEAKEKFQDIQEAYSVLSNSNRRFLYDVGVYESDDQDDKRGMGAFLEEITDMIHDNKDKDSGQETLEDLQRMFVDLFQDEGDAGISSGDYSSSSGGGGGGHAEVDDSSSGKSKLESGSIEFCHELNDSGQSSKGKRNYEY